MNDIKKMIEISRDEYTFLSKIKEEAEKHLEGAPQGSLNIATHKGRVQNYQYDCVTGERRYIKKSESELIRKLAQKEYEKSILTNICSKLYFLEKLIKAYSTAYKDIYDNLDDYRKSIVIPVVSSDEEFVADWYNSHPGNRNKYELKSEIITERGEYVRSKSEKITADIFYKRHIPYIYESEFRLNNGHCIYPDFMLLNIRTRKTFLYEHFGMMDNPEYAENAVKKLNQYEREGLIIGDNLLVTMETSKNPISTRHIEQLIETHLV